MHLRSKHCLARRYVGAIEDGRREFTPPDAKLWRTEMRRVGAMPERTALRSKSRSSSCCALRTKNLCGLLAALLVASGRIFAKKKAGIVHCSSRTAYIPSLVVVRSFASTPRVCPLVSGREQLRVARIFSHGRASGAMALLPWDTA